MTGDPWRFVIPGGIEKQTAAGRNPHLSIEQLNVYSASERRTRRCPEFRCGQW